MDERVEKEISFKSIVFITDWKATLVELGDRAQFRTNKLVSLKEALRAASQMQLLLMHILYCYNGNTLQERELRKKNIYQLCKYAAHSCDFSCRRSQNC